MNALLTAVCCLLAPFATAAETALIAADGGSAWLYTPTDQPDPARTYWLVIGVHGAEADGKGACGISTWADNDVIVLGPSFAAADPASVTKLKALIGEVGQTWKIHPKVFLHGFSEGAEFVHRFAMKEPQLVCGVSAVSAGSWSTQGYGEINPAAAGIPFALSCGEHDKKPQPGMTSSPLEWMKKFSAALADSHFDVTSRVIEGFHHTQSEDSFDLAKSCFARARSLNFSRSAVMAFDFNGTNPLWDLSSEASPPASGVTAIHRWLDDDGMVEESGTAKGTGALSLTVTSGPLAGDWQGIMSTGLLPVRCPEGDSKKLTISFDLTATTARPVEVTVETYDAAKRRTGGLTGSVDPAASDFYQRHVLDLGTLASVGGGAFNARDPFLKITFRIAGRNGWPAGAGNQILIDNLAYAAPAIYVSPAGDDAANDGSRADKPLATIQKAVDRARTGDVIFVMNGTYTSDGSIASIRAAGAPAAWLVLRAHPGHQPVLRSTGWSCIQIAQGSKEVLSTAPGTAYVEIRGLTIQGCAKDGELKYKDKIGKPEPETNGNGISIDGRYQKEKPHHIRIADCTVSDCPGGGISAIQTDRTTIENNHTHGNSHWTIYATSGISVYQGFNFENMPGEYRMLVRNNRSHENFCTQPWEATGKVSDGNGIIIDDMRNTQNEVRPAIGIYHGRILVQGNVSYRNGGSGMHAFSSNRVDFINNTAFGNNTVMDYAQISITQCTDCRMQNNLIVAPEKKPLNRVNGNSTRILVSHNLFWGGDESPFSNGPCLMADPCFVNATAGDFRLKPGSPALHAGGFFGNLPIRFQDGGMRGIDRAPVIGALPAED